MLMLMLWQQSQERRQTNILKWTEIVVDIGDQRRATIGQILI